MKKNKLCIGLMCVCTTIFSACTSIETILPREEKTENTSPKIDVEKEITKLSITKFEAVDGDNWLIELATTPSAVVEVENALFRQTATASEDGKAEFKIERKEFNETHLSITASAKDRVQSKTILATIPKADAYLTLDIENATQEFEDDSFQKTFEKIGYKPTRDLLGKNIYNKDENLIEFPLNNRISIPVSHKGIISVRVPIDGDIYAEELVLDKEKNIVTIKNPGSKKEKHVNLYNKYIEVDNENPMNSNGTYSVSYYEYDFYFDIITPEGTTQSQKFKIRTYLIGWMPGDRTQN